VAAQIAARGGPVLRARLLPDDTAVATLRGRRVLAFAGIGDPARFFATLRAIGAEPVETRAFAYHHPFTAEELAALAAAARRGGLTLVTTEKDLARLGGAVSALGVEILTLPVTLTFEDAAPLRLFLLDRLNRVRADKRR
jgi:tetraacyldisaccharide 4'-kinase